MKAVIYARVSSEKQVEKDLSISAQLKALRKFCKNNGWLVVKEFVDKAESARTVNRPAFQEMISLAKQKQKQFDTIVVWKLSRFARNREDSIIYKSLLRRQGITVISMHEKFDDSPAGKLFEGMIEVIDEFYSLNLAQDTIRGLKENAKRGFRNGGVPPIGYKNKKVKDGGAERTKLEPDKNYAPIVKRIYQMCIKGLGAKEIVKTLNEEGVATRNGNPWSKNQILYILRNEAYTGTTVWKTRNQSNGRLNGGSADDIVRVENTHTPLIDNKTFQQAQDVIRSRTPKVSHPRTVNSKYILSGLLFCGNCGLAMIGTAAKTSRYFYYSCQNYCKRGKNVCDAKPVSKKKIEEFVIDRLKTLVLTEENLEELVQLTNEELNRSDDDVKGKLKTIDNQIGQLKSRLDKLFDSLETGKISIEIISPRIEKLQVSMDRLEREKLNLESHLDDNKTRELDPKVIKAYALDLKNLLGKGTIIEQRSFIKSFIKKVVVHKADIEIDYTIPLPKRKVEPVNREVLPMESNGSPGGT